MLPIICIAIDSIASGARYRRSACIDTDMLRLVATRAEFHHIVITARKDWKHVLVQKVVTLNTCCHTACLTFQLPHINWFFFWATDDNPQLALFRTCNVWKNATNLQSDEKVLQFTCYCGDISGKVGKSITVFFFWNNLSNQNYVWIILLKMTYLDFPR